MSTWYAFIYANGLGDGSKAYCFICSKCCKTSGARYSGVFIENTGVSSFERTNADPKSINFTPLKLLPSNSIKILSGFMSPCTIPKEDKKSIPFIISLNRVAKSILSLFRILYVS